MDPNTEIRKLRPAEFYTLARILAASDSWKTLMAVVPKEATPNNPKFNNEHFALIEQASSQQRRSGAEIFLEEWSTMGKRRPTLQSTLDLLVSVDLFRAADYIAVDLLHKHPPKRPECGPAAPIDISDEEIAKLLKQTSSEFELPGSHTPNSEESLSSVLNGIEYPSQLSVVNSSAPHLADEISMLRIHPEEISTINSNLMQFSGSNVESRANNNSNLIQFSSSSIRSTKLVDSAKNLALGNGIRNVELDTNSRFLPQQQNIVYTSSWNSATTENISSNENNNRVRTTGSRSNISAVSDSNNCTEFELQSSELPAVVVDMGRGPTTTNSELRTSQLPQFVAEIARERSSQSDTETNTESVDESTLSINSSHYSNNITSSSNNNTDSNIPICVNFPSGSLMANELLSAELPQFVADLGHRHSTTASDANVSTDQYLPLSSQELPLAVSECNKLHSRGEMSRSESKSAELPQFVVEL